MTNPVHNTNANKVIKLIEKPKKLRKMNVDKIEIGTVITGIIVLLTFLRKIRIIMVTRSIAKHRVKITSSRASETKSEVS